MVNQEVAETLAASIARGHVDADVLWAALPTLHECARAPDAHPGWIEFARDALLRSSVVGPRLVRVGDVAALINTENQERTLTPVLNEAARRRGVRPQIIHTATLRPSTIMHGWKRCSRLDADLRAAALELDITLHAADIRRRLLKAIRGGLLLHHALRQYDVRTLIVSNQHLADHRAALRLAHRNGMSTLYVPHAPAASNDAYRDLPVTAAALRGDFEVRFYADLGARRERLHSTGNPAFPEVEPPSRLDGPVVLAVSPWPRERLATVIDLVRRGVGQNTTVVVAPHPRSRRSELRRLVPSGWSIHAGRTLELLQNGPRLLVQHSSGVAWEGLYLGIPTVEIAFNDEAPSYPLITPPYITSVRDTDGMREAVKTPPSQIDRSALRAWARRWCASVDGPAARKVVDVMEDLPEGGALALDAWSIR